MLAKTKYDDQRVENLTNKILNVVLLDLHLYIRAFKFLLTINVLYHIILTIKSGWQPIYDHLGQKTI